MELKEIFAIEVPEGDDMPLSTEQIAILMIYNERGFSFRDEKIIGKRYLDTKLHIKEERPLSGMPLRELEDWIEGK